MLQLWCSSGSVISCWCWLTVRMRACFCPDISLKPSSGFTLTNSETQSWTAVSGLVWFVSPSSTLNVSVYTCDINLQWHVQRCWHDSTQTNSTKRVSGLQKCKIPIFIFLRLGRSKPWLDLTCRTIKGRTSQTVFEMRCTLYETQPDARQCISSHTANRRELCLVHLRFHSLHHSASNKYVLRVELKAVHTSYFSPHHSE